MEPLAKISDSIYARTDGKSIGNVGMIVTDSGNYLIDTSNFPVMGREIRKQAESVGTGKINGVFLTHTHFDHTGGMQHFSDVPSYAHKLLDENFRDRYMSDEFVARIMERKDKDKFENLTPTPPSKIFETNPLMPEDNEQIEMYQTGGHTNGSAFIYYKKDNVIFAGDNLFAEVFPWGGDVTSDPYEWIQGLDLMLKFKPTVMIPGHGSVQYSLTQAKNLKLLLGKVIDLGEKLHVEGVSDEDALAALMEIDGPKERWKNMKSDTFQQWYRMIKNH